MNQYIQIIFYHFILSEPSLALRMNPDFFDAKSIQVCFKYAREYVIKYHQAPSASQLKELLHLDNKQDVVSDDNVDVLYSSQNNVNDYTYDWLYDNATSWAQWKNFLNSLKNTIAYVKLNQDNVSVENVKEIMEHAKGSFNKSCILEFTDDGKGGSDFWDAASHKQTKLVRSSSGYPFIDMCLKGGYFPGCLICFVGSPKIGKSLWLQNLCAASVKKGENNAYISLELPEEMIHSRIGSNMFSIPSMDYEKVTADQPAFKEKMTAFKKSCLVPPGRLIVKSFPTSTMSVLDLEAWLLEKEEELSTEGKPFKFKNVFIDYINIMRNYRNPNSENTYMKIKQLAEDVKAIGIKHDWAMITATQTTRSQYDTTDMLASQVSESTGLGATVDAMFGIIADSYMKAKGEYYLKCLYDRVAPEDNKRKRFINDKTFLRISEDLSAPIEDMGLMEPGGSPNFKQFANERRQFNNGGNSPQTTQKYVQNSQPAQNTVSVPMLSDSLEENGGTVATQGGFPGMVGVTGAGLF